jgi:hypothetical protein
MGRLRERKRHAAIDQPRDTTNWLGIVAAREQAAATLERAAQIVEEVRALQVETVKSMQRYKETLNRVRAKLKDR